MTQPVSQSGHKRRKHKNRGSLKGFHHYVGRSKITRKLVARRDRHNYKDNR